MSMLLLAAVVFAWGFSWYAITLQVAEASALISLTYRFILAASVMCLGLVITKNWKAIPWRDQTWVFGLGFCLFSMNFLSFYIAAYYLTSGLMSVIFSTAAIFGAFNARIFLKTALELRVILAALIGTCGLYLLLSPDIGATDTAEISIWVFVLPFVGTYLFSIGNLISNRLTRTYTLPNVIGQGMVWGALILVGFSLVLKEEWVMPRSTFFWSGVVYLALISSLLAFITYLALVNRVGPARASYATVLFPVVAMLVSTVAENYVWSLASGLGLLMALGGTILIFTKPSGSKRQAAHESPD